jgi:benzoyl-CoA reductase subunit C
MERARAVLRDGYEGAIRAAKARDPHGRVLGAFPVWSPFEIYRAAGFRVIGLIGGGTSIELLHADARFQSFVCSIAKSTLELGLQGKLEGLDAAVFHSICDVARNLASVFRRNFPAMHVEYIHLPQGEATDDALAYTAAEFRRVARNLNRRFGAPVREDRLRTEIARGNEIRRTVRRLYDLRAAQPEKVPSAELALLMRAQTLMDPSDWLALARDAEADFRAREAKPRDQVRAVLHGAFCEPPPIGLIEAVERAGCYLLDDDVLSGWNWFEGDVDEDGDPFVALARAYLMRSRPSPVRLDPARPRDRALVERVRARKADAVLFLFAKFCEPALFDYVLDRRAVEAAGLPHLRLEFEEKMWTFERPRTEVETFAESLLFD